MQRSPARELKNLHQRDEAEPSERAQNQLQTDGEEQCIKVRLPDSTTFYSFAQLQNEASGEGLKAEKRKAIKPGRRSCKIRIRKRGQLVKYASLKKN